MMPEGGGAGAGAGADASSGVVQVVVVPAWYTFSMVTVSKHNVSFPESVG